MALLTLPKQVVARLLLQADGSEFLQKPRPAKFTLAAGVFVFCEETVGGAATADGGKPVPVKRRPRGWDLWRNTGGHLPFDSLSPSPLCVFACEVRVQRSCGSGSARAASR